VDGELTHLEQVIDLEAAWDMLPGSKGARYPFSFSERECREIEDDLASVA